MGSRAKENKMQLLAFHTVDENPIRLHMAVSKS